MSESQSISKIIQKAGGKTLVELLESEEKAKNCKNSIWEESEKIGKNKRLFCLACIYHRFLVFLNLSWYRYNKLDLIFQDIRRLLL